MSFVCNIYAASRQHAAKMNANHGKNKFQDLLKFFRIDHPQLYRNNLRHTDRKRFRLLISYYITNCQPSGVASYHSSAMSAVTIPLPKIRPRGTLESSCRRERLRKSWIMDGQHQGMNRPVIVVVDVRPRRQKPTDDHCSEGVCRSTPTVLVNCWSKKQHADSEAVNVIASVSDGGGAGDQLS